MSKRVMVITSACCTGWAFTFEASDHELNAVYHLCKWYNDMPQWRARGCDSSVTLYTSVDNAIAEHNKDRDECGDVDGRVQDVDGLLKFYDEDGCGREVALDVVLKLLATDPTQEGWLDVACETV